MAAARQTNQPAFDFLTGESPPRQPLRETRRQSMSVRPDIHNENLRAQIKTLQYELETLKQERELRSLREQSDVREAEKRVEAEYRRAQVNIPAPHTSCTSWCQC